MNPRLTRGEYWLLEAVVEFPAMICLLDQAPNDMEAVLHKKPHGLGTKLLTQTLTEMLCKRWISVIRFTYKPGMDRITKEKIKTIPTRAEVADFLKEGKPSTEVTYYSLTPKGGAIWESFARPNWDKLVVDERLELDENFTGTTRITSQTRALLDEYLKALPSFGMEFLHKPKVEPIKKWKATYWKTLPMAWRVRLSYREQKLPASLELYRQRHLALLKMRTGWYSWR